jgi:hypothetical protein
MVKDTHRRRAKSNVSDIVIEVVLLCCFLQATLEFF